MLGVKRRISPPYHPQTDGKTERSNQVLEGYLQTFVNYHQNDWYQLLHLAEHAYNNTTTRAHKMTQFCANYGFPPYTEWMKEREAHNAGATMFAHSVPDIPQQAKQSLENRRESIKENGDPKVTERPSFEVGDWVRLYAKNTRIKRPTKKLSPKQYGPFKVLEKKGSQASKVEISPRWKIHPVFYVSWLEPYRG